MGRPLQPFALHAILVAILIVLLSGPARADGPESAPASVPGTSSTLLERAEASFLAGELEAAAALASRIKDHDPLAGRARYLQGYALYKLGRLEPASLVLDRARAIAPTAEVSFLTGLCAIGMRRFALALVHLEPLAASGKAPWAAVARELVLRARQELAAEQRASARSLHLRLIARAEGELRLRRFEQARRSLEEADRALPDQLLVHYYRGYLAHQAGDATAARRHLRAALRVSPGDEWSRYMLALSLEGAERRAILDRLASSASEPTLRAAARGAIAEPPRRSRSGFSVQLELGTGLDTNPAYATEATTSLAEPPPGQPPPQGMPPLQPPPAPPTSPTTGELDAPASALALRGAVSLYYRRELAAGQLGSVGFHLHEQGYLVGGADASKTELSASAEYRLARGRLDLRASYDYALHLFDHAPLLSVHELGLAPRLRLRPWLWAGGSARLRWRTVHDESYRYLGALELSGSLSATAVWKRLSARVGYQLQRGWSEQVAFETWVTILGRPVFGDYLLDLTAFAHGPEVELELRLPLQLALSASAWLFLHSFVSPDTLQSTSIPGVVYWRGDRRDTQLLTVVELKRPFGHGLEVGIVFSSVDNVSSLGSDAPLSYSYSRRMLTGNLRWRWPFR